MNTKQITRKQAATVSGVRNLPTGCNWFIVDDLQFYPRVGTWSQVVATANGMRAVIGSSKLANREAA